jgi:hypothetical protein
LNESLEKRLPLQLLQDVEVNDESNYFNDVFSRVGKEDEFIVDAAFESFISFNNEMRSIQGNVLKCDKCGGPFSLDLKLSKSTGLRLAASNAQTFKLCSNLSDHIHTLNEHLWECEVRRLWGNKSNPFNPEVAHCCEQHRCKVHTFLPADL